MKDVSGTKLVPIVRAVRERAAARRAVQPLAELERLVRPDPARRERFLRHFVPGELAFVCELKRRSPSAGLLLRDDLESTRPGSRYAALAAAYRAGGAAALSVLTEEDHFGGSLADLGAVASTGLPKLRKDFVLDAGMVLESAHHGAEAILLLACLLDDAELADLRQLARELGLAVLLEVHDERELDRAVPLAPELLGVNARDLATLAVDLRVHERLLPLVPRTSHVENGRSSPLRVAESGLRSLDDLVRARAAGADAVLVGESLVQSTDAAGTLLAWNEALRG